MLKVLPSAVCEEAFPADPDFPQLKIASDPALMLETFRAHLRPVPGKVYQIQDCVPFRFRCRQSTSRCVLQYSLRLVEPGTGRELNQWVTGVVYAEDGEAERLWQEIRAADPVQEIPEAWRSFEPICFIPNLQMLVQVFPYDRKLPNLCRVMSGALRFLEPQLLAQFGLDQWRVEQRKIEPTRYRTEMGAALKYTLQARQPLTAKSQTRLCYLKVYRNDRGEETFELLKSLAERDGGRQHPPGFGVRQSPGALDFEAACTEVEGPARAKAPEDWRTPRRLPAQDRPYSVVRPIAYLRELRTLVLEEAPGTALQQLLLQNGDPQTAVRAVARAVAAFNQGSPLPSQGSPLPSDESGARGEGALGIKRHHSLAEQFDELKRASTLVQWACPEMRAEAKTITAALVAGLEEVPPSPIHRDLKPDHIFLHGDRVIFIDLDSVALGDPVRDPAHLFAHLTARVGMDAMPREQARTAATDFVEEYFAHVPEPWRKQFPLHCAGALIEVAGGIFKRQEPRWTEKVSGCVEEAQRLLKGGLR